MLPRTSARSKFPIHAGTFVLLSLTATLLLFLLPTTKVSAASTQVHVVADGESLTSIAQRYCTTQQELYGLNRHLHGTNAEYLPAGTALTVINHCTTGGGSGWVYDRGPTAHARGSVSGSIYYVRRGDTIYSIANRFGVDQYALMSVNGVHNPKTLQAGSKLTIPGLGTGPTPTPTYPPGPTPTPTTTPVGQVYMTIEQPTWGTYLPSTFTVSGRVRGLFEGNVVVQARDRNGVVLAEQATTLQGINVGTGGEGSYNVQLTVNVAANTPGFIIAFSPGTPSAYASVDVTYIGGNNNAYLTITEPVSGTSLPTTFTARGAGRGLIEGNVVVLALDLSGRVLAEAVTTLQGANVGTGGEGTWGVQLSVSQVTEGRIVVSSPGSAASESVSVRFNGQSPGLGPSTPVKDFRHGECGVRPRAGAPAYGYPEGPQRGTFAGGQEYNVMRAVYVNGVYWYYVDIAPGSGNPFVWVKESDLENTRGACTW